MAWHLPKTGKDAHASSCYVSTVQHHHVAATPTRAALLLLGVLTVIVIDGQMGGVFPRQAKLRFPLGKGRTRETQDAMRCVPDSIIWAHYDAQKWQ